MGVIRVNNRPNITLRFLVTFIILGIFLPRFGVITLWQALLTASVVTLVSYISGFIILSKIRGSVTLVIDVVLNTFMIWLVQLITPFMYISLSGALIVSLLFALAQLLLYNIMRKQYLR
jgi:hypothetical protein